LLAGDRVLGVLEVLDRARDERFTLAEMDLLSLFAGQAAIALDLMLRARRAETATPADGALGRLAAALESSPPEQRADALELLAALERVLRA
jgi:GAF domain-containing protein